MGKSPLPPNQSSGSIVRQLRNENRRSMTNLAEAVGISRTYLWQIETSDHLPNFEIANKLASALGKTPAEIWSSYSVNDNPKEKMTEGEISKSIMERNMNKPNTFPQTYEDASFENWIDILNSIYGGKNSKRTPSEMWLRAVSDASKVGEAVREGEPYDAMRYFIHTLGWTLTTFQKLLEKEYAGLPALMTYDNKPHKNLTTMILSKYPGICPYCGFQTCNCPSMRETLAKETKIQRRQRLLKTYSTYTKNFDHPNSIADTVEMFEKLYRQIHYGETIEKITFHFLEEVGEVAWCITSLEEGTSSNIDTISLNVQLAEEISDVVAWGIGVVGKLISLAEQSDRLTTVIRIGEEFSESNNSILEHQYVIPKWLCHIFYDANLSDFVCHTCHKRPCRC